MFPRRGTRASLSGDEVEAVKGRAARIIENNKKNGIPDQRKAEALTSPEVDFLGLSGEHAWAVMSGVEPNMADERPETWDYRHKFRYKGRTWLVPVDVKTTNYSTGVLFISPGKAAKLTAGGHGVCVLMVPVSGGKTTFRFAGAMTTFDLMARKPEPLPHKKEPVHQAPQAELTEFDAACVRWIESACGP